MRFVALETAHKLMIIWNYATIYNNRGCILYHLSGPLEPARHIPLRETLAGSPKLFVRRRAGGAIGEV
jgi:hypothetical protein